MDWFRAVKKRQDIRRLRGRGPQARPRWFASSRSDGESRSRAATAESRSAESTTSRTCTCAQSIVPRKRSSCRISRCRLSRNTAPKTSYSSGPTCRRRYSRIRSAVESTGGPPGTAARESSAPREHRVRVGLPEPGAILNVERRHDGGPQVLLGGIARRPGNTPQRSRQGHRTSSAGARERGCFPREALTARTAWHTGPAASPPPPYPPCLLSHRHPSGGCPRILRAFALHLPNPHSSRSPASPLTRDKPLPATAEVLPQPHADTYRSSSRRVKYVRDPSF